MSDFDNEKVSSITEILDRRWGYVRPLDARDEHLEYYEPGEEGIFTAKGDFIGIYGEGTEVTKELASKIDVPYFITKFLH